MGGGEVLGHPALRDCLLHPVGVQPQRRDGQRMPAAVGSGGGLERLRGRLESALHVDRPRRPTRPTKASEQRRIEAKRTRHAAEHEYELQQVKGGDEGLEYVDE